MTPGEEEAAREIQRVFGDMSAKRNRILFDYPELYHPLVKLWSRGLAHEETQKKLQQRYSLLDDSTEKAILRGFLIWLLIVAATVALVWWIS